MVSLAYTENLLMRFGMSESKSTKTPLDANETLTKATESDECMDRQLYQFAIGSLLYLSVGTRPDITFAVSLMAKFCANPLKHHWTGVKRIMCYLRGTTHHGISYSKQGAKERVGYSDADWGGDTDDRKSTSGYVLSGGPVSWRSKKQSSVALSTAEAEYVAHSGAAQESIWLRQLLTELGNPPLGQTTIFEDNQSAIAMSGNPQFHGRAKHIDIKCHFVREQVNSGTVKLAYCPTADMVVDMLTKALGSTQFRGGRNNYVDLGVQIVDPWDLILYNIWTGGIFFFLGGGIFFL